MEQDVFFLGGLYQKGQEREILNNSIYSYQGAANNLQWAIVEGLDKNLKYPVSIINSMYVGAWPFRYKKLLIKTNSFSHTEGSDDINVGFVNLYGFTNIIKKITLRPYLRKKLNKNSPNKKILIAYGMNDTILELLIYIKKIDSNITTCLIVPDLPEFTNTSNNKKTDRNTPQLYKKLISVDKYVLLTKYMADILKIKNNYIVVEGMTSNSLKSVYKIKKEKKIRTVVYTGILHARYGILNLLDAFSLIKSDDYKLIICGFGDSEDKVLEAVREDSRIEFKGLLSKDEIVKIQQEATVLVNPRQNNEDFTKYSFPSKNMEYLASGTPMIAYKLDGIPDDYDKYIIYVSDNDVISLSNKILETCEKEQCELNEFGSKARDFVENEKNNIVQVKKIIDYINA